MKKITLSYIKRKTTYIDLFLENKAFARVAYAWLGDSNKPCLVLCQGSNLNLLGWDLILLNCLAEHFSLLVFDYPGLTGSSDLLQGKDYGALAQAKAINLLLQQLQIVPCAMLGYSLGGWVAQTYAAHYPLKKLILIATDGGGAEAFPSDFYLERWKLLDMASTWRQKMTIFDLVFSKLSLKRRLILALHFLRAGKIGRLAKGPILERQAQLCEAWYAGPSQASLVSCSSLVFIPEQDEILPVENQYILAKNLQDADVKIYPTAGHALPYHSPEKVAREIWQFVYN